MYAGLAHIFIKHSAFLHALCWHVVYAVTGNVNCGYHCYVTGILVLQSASCN